MCPTLTVLHTPIMVTLPTNQVSTQVLHTHNSVTLPGGRCRIITSDGNILLRVPCSPLTRFQMMNHSLSSREMAASYLPILPEFKQICWHTVYTLHMVNRWMKSSREKNKVKIPRFFFKFLHIKPLIKINKACLEDSKHI